MVGPIVSPSNLDATETVGQQKEEVAALSARIRAKRRTFEETGRAWAGGYRHNRLRLKLWEELNKDQPPSRLHLFRRTVTAFDGVHRGSRCGPYPTYSKTLDDSEANKILADQSQSAKRNRAPADVTEWASRYGVILARAGTLPRNKRWRFAHDAIEKFADEEGFLARN